MPTFTFGTTLIEYNLHYKPNKRDIAIAVDWISGVTVTVSEGTSQEQIDTALRRKARWVLRKRAEFREIKHLTTHHEFISGEKFPYLGRQYRLKVHASNDGTDASINFINGRFSAVVPISSSPTWREEHLRAAFRDWYITHGLSKVQHRVQLFGSRLGLQPSKVVVKDQRARWGSCTKNGTININWRILMAPMSVVDYVIVHELGHMIRQDHSSDFWTTVQSVIPDYDVRKEWLRIHGPMLDL